MSTQIFNVPVNEVPPARELFYAVELHLDHCGETYNVAPCNPPVVGNECYNTFQTCQDIPNYNRQKRVYIFYLNTLSVNPGDMPALSFPCLERAPRVTPGKILPFDGMGTRSVVDITLKDFPHNDRSTDPYFNERASKPLPVNSFFGVLRARNPFYTNRPLTIRVGWIVPGEPLDYDALARREYIIEQFDGFGTNSSIRIVARDVLKKAHDARAQAPTPTRASLNENLIPQETRISLGAGQGAQFEPAPGYCRIDTEIMRYDAVLGDELQQVARGQFGTVADDHEIFENVQLAVYYNQVNLIDIIYDLLTTYSGIDEDLIPYDEGREFPTGTPDLWDEIKAEFFNSSTLTRILSEPVGVTDLITQLTSENGLSIFWHEIEQHIHLKALSAFPPVEWPERLDTARHILAGSLSVKDGSALRLSQIWTYYEPFSPLHEKKNPGDYKYLTARIETDPESENAYGDKRVRAILSDWFSLNHVAAINSMQQRILFKYRDVVALIKFRVDARHASFWTSDNIRLSALELPTVNGLPADLLLDIISAREVEPAAIYEYEALATVYVFLRRGQITPDDWPDYSAATEQQQEDGCFISDGANEFPDDSPPYQIG